MSEAKLKLLNAIIDQYLDGVTTEDEALNRIIVLVKDDDA